jgi:hypothetical protein
LIKTKPVIKISSVTTNSLSIDAYSEEYKTLTSGGKDKH